jgi:ribosomal protein L15
MSNVIAVLNEERTRVARRLAALDAAIKALGGGTAAPASVVKHNRRKLSAEARARISAAQKARWAKTKTKK